MSEYNFFDRHIGPRDNEISEMLDVVNTSSIQKLLLETIPQKILLNKEMNLPSALSESRLIDHMKEIAKKNKNYRSYIGMGYFNTILPGVIQRNILENPGWYTAYTPYQAEISQGRLEALLNFQTMVLDLTAMELANASLLDEGTAAAEGMAMLFGCRSRLQKRDNIVKFFVSDLCYPQTIEIIKTRAIPLGIDLIVGNHNEVKLDSSFFGCILQYPAKYGAVIDYSDFVKLAKNHEVGVVVAADLLSLTFLTPPGEWGADVVVGIDMQNFNEGTWSLRIARPQIINHNNQ